MDTIPVIVENEGQQLNHEDSIRLQLSSGILVKEDGNDPMLSLSMATVANTTQSVITSNHQSVIQAPLSNGSLEHPGDNEKRREVLSRRPSYRRILNELSETSESTNIPTGIKMEVVNEVKSEDDDTETDSNITYQTSAGTVTIQQSPQTIQISTPMNNNDQNNGGLPTFAVANALSQAQIVQQNDGNGNAIWMPGGHVVVQGAGGDMQTYQIRSSTSNNLSVVQGGNIQSPQQMAEEASRKRELRLLKNREAARDCRRKKKEYIKCLENRVHVLETQNKALIDELKTLKEMYCSKDNM